MGKITYIGINPNFGRNSVFRLREGQDPPSGVPLDPRLDLRRHSPDGFAWGYGGSGPAQLSLALLADFLGKDRRAVRLYQDFKFSVVARLPQRERWILTGEEIAAAVDRIEQQHGWAWSEAAQSYEDEIGVETA